MKRWIVAAIAVLLVAFMAACGANDETPYEPPREEQEEQPTEPQYVEIEGIYRRVMPRSSLTIEHFLEDLDYMVYVLENNFALLDVAYWAHGVDYRELAANAREAVLAMEEPSETMFLAIMRWHFFPLMGAGHFEIFTPTTLNQMWYLSSGDNASELAMMNFELMQSPLAERFYGRSAAIVEYSTAIRQIAELKEPLHNRYFGYITDNIGWPDDLHLVTEIIEEGRIAYIYPAGNMSIVYAVQSGIFNFFRETRDFDHLIIDMRGVGGGNPEAFIEVFIRPNITEAVLAPQTFHFFQDGPHVRRFGENMFLPLAGGNLTNLEPYRPANEVLEVYDLPEFNRADIERLDFGVLSGRSEPMIHPHPEFDQDPAFTGKIWMLTDHRMVSASQLAAWYSMELDFATHVGDVTGGMLGGPRTLVFMPNTGIIFWFDIFYITDSSGRPLEAGTTPHYFNRPGLDALETVLAMIEEGDY